MHATKPEKFLIKKKYKIKYKLINHGYKLFGGEGEGAMWDTQAKVIHNSTVIC